jgi:hypothetical protein
MMNNERLEVHEMALLFPKQTPEETSQLRDNMVQRVCKGLSPLESPILLVGGKIADGRHRYEIWQELAAEGACDGYFAKNNPPLDESQIDGKDGEDAVLLRINSRNLCQRSLPADQKAAIFLQQAKDFPGLGLLVQNIRLENEKRMKAGKPLDDKSQGLSTNEKLGNLAGVSGSTMKSARKLERTAPAQLKEVAKGKTTTKAALSKVSNKREANKPGTLQPRAKKTKSESPNSPPPRRNEPSREFGSKSVTEETRTVTLRLNDISMVAEFGEFFTDYGIHPNSKKNGEGTVFEFSGSSQDENNLLTFIGDLMVAKGPVDLDIALNPRKP